MKSLEEDKIIRKLIDYQRQIWAMDHKVKQYLSDRRNNPHPFHEELISEIRRFENEIHRIHNTEIELRLDNLMYSLLIHERDWKRGFAKGVKAPREQDVDRADQEIEKRVDMLVDKVHAIAGKKWAELGVTNTESKEELAERIRPICMKAFKEGLSLGLVYDNKSHSVQVRVKKKDTS